MRIKYLSCTWDEEVFGRSMCQKYGLEFYRQHIHLDAPVVFFGCYSLGAKDMIIRHRGLIVIVWSGSDSTRLHERSDFVEYCKANKHRIFHIAHSHWIQTDLRHFGFEYIDRVVLPVDLSDFKFDPNPGKMVYHYGSHDRKFYYGTHLMEKLRSRWDRHKDYPNVFITYNGSYDKKELIKYYADSFIGVRLTEHDNMALSCIELGLMGRPSIFNGNIPCAIPYMENPYTTYDPRTRTQWVYQDENILSSVGSIILDYWTKKIEPSKELAEEMREFVHDDQEWLNTEFYD
jgi:hypothetical protein